MRRLLVGPDGRCRHNLYRDEVLDGATLPVKHVPTARASAAKSRPGATSAASKRDISRQVRDGQFVRPETSDAELASLLDDPRTSAAGSASSIASSRCAPASVVRGGAEVRHRGVGRPGCAEWLEWSSCSLPRLPGPAPSIATARAEGQAGAPAHVERLGPGPPRVMIAVARTYHGRRHVAWDVLRPYMRHRLIAAGTYLADRGCLGRADSRRDGCGTREPGAAAGEAGAHAVPHARASGLPAPQLHTEIAMAFAAYVVAARLRRPRQPARASHNRPPYVTVLADPRRSLGSAKTDSSARARASR